jgi:hypothetical protein
VEQPVQADTSPQEKSQQSPSAAVPILKKALSQMDSEDGWVGLGPLTSENAA